jgi:hypothetical protein
MPAIQTAAFTVVTPNYLAHAYSVRKSFLAHHPGCEFFIGLIGYENHIPEKNDCVFICLNELTDERINGMVRRYTPFELSCALKPYFATHIFETRPQVNRLIYLDGDMYVFGPFHPQSDAAVTLSPHRTQHIKYLPGGDDFSSISLLRYGVYNAGYFELLRKPETTRFVAWWQSLLEHHAYNKPDENLFTDQLWLSAVPSFFDDVFINKNPGCNIGFWNLIERNVRYENGSWLVNGVPLILFHYSTYNIETPERPVNFDHPFLTFAEHPSLKPLFEIYRRGLMEAGYEKIKNLPYPFQYEQPGKKKPWWKRLFR